MFRPDHSKHWRRLDAVWAITAGRAATRFEQNDAVTRAEPQLSFPAFEQVEDGPVGQPVVLGVAFEFVAVESRESLVRAEPQKTARVVNDAGDTIVSKSVRSCIRLKWKGLGVSGVEREPAS